MIVRFTPLARKEYLEAVSSIVQGGELAANRFIDKVETALSQLGQFPQSGRSVPEFGSLVPYREVLILPFRFFYRVVGDTVWIVALWHERQMPANPEDA